ncbi:hypothetical protein Syun_022726 [Stephania yunnanensis]|uniref:Uncharacterized protein n=1 Tax=Stephania yunnanensis TaxID=152371 RepID=A0AAP0FA13_9MAGN
MDDALVIIEFLHLQLLKEASRLYAASWVLDIGPDLQPNDYKKYKDEEVKTHEVNSAAKEKGPSSLEGLGKITYNGQIQRTSAYARTRIVSNVKAILDERIGNGEVSNKQGIRGREDVSGKMLEVIASIDLQMGKDMTFKGISMLTMAEETLMVEVIFRVIKMDRTSLLGDNIDYMKELLERIKNLQEEIDVNSYELNLIGIFKELKTNEIMIRNTPKFDVERRITKPDRRFFAMKIGSDAINNGHN